MISQPPRPTAATSPEADVLHQHAWSFRRIQWDQFIPLVSEPFVAAWFALHVPLATPTLIFACIYYAITATGITAGYHRLWSHKSYSAAWPFRLWMALAGAGSVQGSIKWWCRRHRAHHRFTDTDSDPYSAHRGLLWSHFLWMLFKPGPATWQAQSLIDMRDLNADPIVRYQHKFFIPIALTMSFIVPTVIAHYGWNDGLGGFVWAGLVRMVLLHHATFCVNSLAHYLGESTYDDRLTPRDHILTALITFGEGMHNFHHEFPCDYRNAVRWYEWDPTKWVIYTSSLIGLTWNLKRFPDNEVKKGALLMDEKKLQARRRQLYWGVDINTLPYWTVVQFHDELNCNPMLIIVDDIVHNVSKFVQDHPGGAAILKTYFGRDATNSFNGHVYNHSVAARNLLSHMRIAIVKDFTASSVKFSHREE